MNPNPNPSPNPGHGVFARCALRANQAVAEYGGPRLPLDMLQHGEYALEVTGTDTFIDGNWENSAALSGGAHLTPARSGMPRYL